MFNVHSNLNIHTWRWCNVTIGLRSQLFTVSHCSVFEMRAPHARASVITFAWISHILLSSPDYTRNVSRSTTTVLDVFTLNFVSCKYHMQWGETWDGYGSETLHVTDKDHWFSEFSQFMSRPYSNFHFPEGDTRYTHTPRTRWRPYREEEVIQCFVQLSHLTTNNHIYSSGIFSGIKEKDLKRIKFWGRVKDSSLMQIMQHCL